MKYTFGDAKKILSACCHAKLTDIGDKINMAIAALCSLNPWEHEFLRQVVRLTSVSPVISLPQGATGLVRACVNGKPTTLHGQDFQFLSGGPGDLLKVPFGYSALGDDILDQGSFPVWRQPAGYARLCAVRCGDDEQGKVIVEAMSAVNELITFELTPQSPTEKRVYNGPLIRTVISVTIGDRADESARPSYIKLFMQDLCPDGTYREHCVAKYHPDVHVPEFRCYRLPSPQAIHLRPGEAYDILAEIQYEPLPLVEDTDVIPIPSLEPIKAMLLYEYNNQNLETDAADKYLTQAMTWITRMNSARNTQQGPTVINVQREGSLGELSDYYANV